MKHIAIGTLDAAACHEGEKTTMHRIALRLEGRSEPILGRSWESTETLRVGRLPSLEIHLPDPSVSRTHAELAPRPGGWAVWDLGSSNGTYRNGERLGRAEVQLRPGDQLQFGDVCLAVTMPGGGTSACRTPTTAPAPTTCEPSVPAEWLARFAVVGRACEPTEPLTHYLNALLWESAEMFDATGGALLLAAAGTSPEETVYLAESDRHAWWLTGGRPEAAREDGRAHLVVAPTGVADGPALYAPFADTGRALGILCLVRGAEQEAFTERERVQAEALARILAPSLRTAVAFHRRHEEQQLRSLTAIAEMLRLRDGAVGSHAQRVTDYALMLAEQLGLSERQRYHLRAGAPLHDLGKIGLRDEVLRKPDRLTAEEEQHVRACILRGAQLLEQIPSLSPLLPIVRNAQENWDGTGYPDGLAGEGIPLLARVVAVADAFDAMTTHQPYRPAFSVARALEEIQRGAGMRFDPSCVVALLTLRPRLEELHRQRGELTHTLSVRDLRAVLGARAPVSR